MKKILLSLVILTTLTSCEKDDIKDCGCDRVVQTNYAQFNMPNGSTFYGGSFITVNDCTGLNKTWSVSEYGRPNKGDCFKR